MLSLQSSETVNEYSYSSLPMWAGPVQWKNRAQFDALKGALIWRLEYSYLLFLAVYVSLNIQNEITEFVSKTQTTYTNKAYILHSKLRLAA
jgi:hypothetical protein